MFKVNIKETRKTQLASLWFVCIVNFENISHLVLVFIINFEHVNASWVVGNSSG